MGIAQINSYRVRALGTASSSKRVVKVRVPPRTLKQLFHLMRRPSRAGPTWRNTPARIPPISEHRRLLRFVPKCNAVNVQADAQTHSDPRVWSSNHTGRLRTDQARNGPPG